MEYVVSVYSNEYKFTEFKCLVDMIEYMQSEYIVNKVCEGIYKCNINGEDLYFGYESDIDWLLEFWAAANE